MDVTSKSEWINCVIWNNTKGTTQSQLSVKNTHVFTNYYSNQGSSVITVTQLSNSNTEDSEKNGTTLLAPHFTDPAKGDYTLAAESPLVDAGNDEAYGDGLATDFDLAGNPRKLGASIDVGAYESSSTSSIESVGSDGVKGDVVPKYFNLQGMPVPASSLRQGEVYIMQTGATSKKVVM